MNIESQLRNLAKSTYWQSIYKASQKGSGIRLFNNATYLSGLQTRFLYWLSIYEMLFTDLSTYEDDLLTIDVINDDFRTDAYLIYKYKKNDYLWKKHRLEEKQTQQKETRKAFKNPGKETNYTIDFRREE